MLRLLIATALVAVPSTVLAQEAEEASTPPQRIRSVSINKGQQCPRSTADEVVVCTTIEDPYRIPKQMRDQPKETPASVAWGVKADRVMEDNQRVLPGSCSPVGSYGHTGCAQQAAEQWAADKRDAANAGAPPR